MWGGSFMAVLLQFKLILNYDLTIKFRLTPVQMYNIVPPPPLQNSSIENNTLKKKSKLWNNLMTWHHKIYCMSSSMTNNLAINHITTRYLLHSERGAHGLLEGLWQMPFFRGGLSTNISLHRCVSMIPQSVCTITWTVLRQSVSLQHRGQRSSPCSWTRIGALISPLLSP